MCEFKMLFFFVSFFGDEGRRKLGFGCSAVCTNIWSYEQPLFVEKKQLWLRVIAVQPKLLSDNGRYPTFELCLRMLLVWLI
jgi:hypothetical protein